jgi:hypothetical protein
MQRVRSVQTSARPSDFFGYRPPKAREVESKRAQLEIRARRKLAEAGIQGSVRFEVAVDFDPPQKSFDDIAGTGPWIMPLHRCRECSERKTAARDRRRSQARKNKQSKKTGKHQCRKRGQIKVERIDGGRFTCSCPQWLLQRFVDCRHVKDVKAKLGIDSSPYSTARRKIITIWIFVDGPSEATRRSRAKDLIPTRVPKLIAELCERYVEQPRTSGRTGLPLKAVCYALCMKVFWNLSHSALKSLLMKDEYFKSVAVNWVHKKAPKDETFSRRFGKAELQPYLRRFFRRFAYSGHDVDEMLIADSDQISTIRVANSRDQKAGISKAPYRNGTMIKRHWNVGDITGFIYEIDVTLSEGPGSFDGTHLPRLIPAAGPRRQTADKGYEQRRNHKKLAELNVDFFIRQKGNEKRLTARNTWPESAKRLTALENCKDPNFERIIRRRSKVEGTGSASKGRYPHLRLRARESDPEPSFPEQYMGDPEKTADLLSELPEEIIEAVLVEAETAVGNARVNEVLATAVVNNAIKTVVNEQLFDQYFEVENEEFIFYGARTIREHELEIKTTKSKTKPSEDNTQANIEQTEP